MATAKKSAAKAPKRVAKKAVAKRMGRPPRAGAGAGAADRKLFVRLTGEEYEALEGAAIRAGKAVSVYVRDVALSSVESS